MGCVYLWFGSHVWDEEEDWVLKIMSEVWLFLPGTSASGRVIIAVVTLLKTSDMYVYIYIKLGVPFKLM